MVKSEQVQQRGVEVIDVDWVYTGSPAEFIRLPNDLAWPYSSPRHPQAESVSMMIAAWLLTTAFTVSYTHLTLPTIYSV